MRPESGAGALDITLYRRWDALNNPNGPVLTIRKNRRKANNPTRS
jgi:hypothetical protein